MSAKASQFDYSSLAKALRAFGVANRRMTTAEHTAEDIRAANANLAHAQAGEPDAVAAMRESLAEDVLRRADSASSNGSRNSGARRQVNIAAVDPEVRDDAAGLISSTGFAPVDRGGDIAINDLGDFIDGLDKLKKSFEPKPVHLPLRAPSVKLQNHFLSLDRAHSWGRFSTDRIIHGGILTAHGKQYLIVSARMQMARVGYKKQRHNSTFVSTMVFECDEGEKVGRLVISTRCKDRLSRDTYWSRTGLELNARLTARGRHAGWEQGGKGHHSFVRGNGLSDDHVSGRRPQGGDREDRSSFVLQSPIRTKGVFGRLAGMNGKLWASHPFFQSGLETHVLPNWRTGGDIADAIDITSPFNAYFDPQISSDSPLTIYASPFMKIFSTGPTNGPTLVVFLDALSYFDQSDRRKQKLAQHRHLMAVFEKGAQPMLVGE